MPSTPIVRFTARIVRLEERVVDLPDSEQTVMC
jgi:hypothetical protein